MTTTITLSNLQLAAVLAGLRLLQRADILPAEIDEILTAGGELPRIADGDIDQLCEEINTAGELGGDVSDLHLYQRTYAGFVRIGAIVVGHHSANAYMGKHPGTALLALAPGEVALLADAADLGVPEGKVPRGPEPAAVVAIRHELSPQFVGDVLCTMIESGYGWFAWESQERETAADEVLGWRYRAAVAVEIDEDDGTEGQRRKIDAAVIAEAIGKILTGGPTNSVLRDCIASAVAEGDPGRIDAEAADCIAQIAVFGEVRYG